jgi:2-(3-amino-3-carboxypropyl)histidine synthase
MTSQTRTLSFSLEKKRLMIEIQKSKARRVLVQLPEGLKPCAPRIAKIVEDAGAQCFILADPCYGACDMAFNEAQAVAADLIVHYGHTQMIQPPNSCLAYFEARAKVEVKTAVKHALQLLKPWKSIGLVTTVQHVHKLVAARNMLLKEGKRVMVGDAGRLKYPGQVIGCDYSNAEAVESQVDAFLFIGGGRFHAVGVSLATSRPTVVADPYEKRAFSVESEALKTRKQRMASVSEAKQAETFGVLVGLKPGQNRLQDAIKIKDKLKSGGKKVLLFAAREITPEVLIQFPTVDAFVNTACPRLVLDDSSRFSKPMLTINEALAVIDEVDWDTLCRGSWFEN